jgi:hypothetical protein
VAIRHGLRYDICADIAARATTIINEDGLAPHFSQSFRDNPANGIRRATRREGNYKANGARRPSLRTRWNSSQRSRKAQSKTTRKMCAVEMRRHGVQAPSHFHFQINCAIVRYANPELSSMQSA